MNVIYNVMQNKREQAMADHGWKRNKVKKLWKINLQKKKQEKKNLQKKKNVVVEEKEKKRTRTNISKHAKRQK